MELSRPGSPSESGSFQEVQRRPERERAQGHRPEDAAGAVPVVNAHREEGAFARPQTRRDVVAFPFVRGVFAGGQVAALARQFTVDVELVKVSTPSKDRKTSRSCQRAGNFNRQPVPGPAIQVGVTLRFPGRADADVLPAVFGGELGWCQPGPVPRCSGRA